MKRVFDVTLALFGLIVLTPVLILIAGLVRLIDGAPVLFCQMRVGLNGEPFEMLKFRTMVVDAETKGRSITVGRDSRITRLGSVLRKTKLDELPQLMNVLVGDMSFVGPRPEVGRYVERYSPSERDVLKLRPGITDLASFAFFNESDLLSEKSDPEAFYVSVIMPEKIRINLEYAAHSTLWTDLLVIIATVLKALGLKPNLFLWLGIRPPRLGATA